MNLKTTLTRTATQALLLMAIATPAFAQNAITNLIEAIEPPKGTFLFDQWQKARVQLGHDFSGSVGVGKNLSIGGGLRFKFAVEPAFVKDLHQRFDIYTLNFGLNANVADFAGVGINMGAQVTFSRLLDTKAQALTAPVYFIDRIPWTAEKALTNLEKGDAVRIEINSDGSLGKGVEDLIAGLKGHYGVSFSKGSRFIVDLYRLHDDRMRMRLIATRTSGSFGFNAGLDPLNPLKNWEIGVGFLDSQINRWLSCKPVSFSTASNLSHSLPVDTFMVDYIFNLGSYQGRMIYDNLMHVISRIHFEKYLNFERSEVRLAEELLAYVKIAEDQYRQDYRLPIQVRSVDRIFKGRTISEFTTTSLGSGCSRLWSAEFTTYNSKTLVRSYERDDELADFIYLSSDRKTKKDALLGFFGNEYHESSNGLFNAVREDHNDELKPIPTGLSDLIINYESKEKKLTKKEIGHVQEGLKHQAPMVYSMINWGDFANEDRTNGYLNYVFVFHQEALKALPAISGAEIYTKFRDYVDSYPRKMWLPKDNSYNQSEYPTYDQYELDIQQISGYLNTIINSPDANERLNAFGVLRKMSLFQAIGSGFLISLLPQENLAELVYLKVSAGSTENTSAVTFAFGQNDISKIYHSLEYILSVINDRSFDLRTQLDEKGELTIFKTKNDGKQNCATCDRIN